MYQTDGWGWKDVAFACASFTRAWGSGSHSADTRLFAIDYDDWRKILKADNRPLAVRSGDAQNIRIQTCGGHSLHAFTTEAGTIDALGWGAFQTVVLLIGSNMEWHNLLHAGHWILRPAD